ncbi:MAG: hypothetical protein E7311_02930 [Clostridiales bacterium]|nr:hypothetical protein [Clostridiales bacterium]
MRNKRTSGISLVALIVTIIVLIILTATVIVTFMEGGIIEKTKEAVFKSDIRTYQEILAVKNAERQIELATGNGEGTEFNATDLAEIQAIIPEFKEEYKDLIAISNGEIVLGIRNEETYSKWLADLGIGAGNNQGITLASIAEVGDYVAYSIPEGERKTYNITEKLGAEATSWILNNGDDDWNYDSGEEVIGYNEEIKWRVLKNNGTTVTLVSAEPVENIYIYGAQGFIQGAATLDAICSEVYGGRNLNIEDVNEILKESSNWGEDETNWQYIGNDWEVHNIPAGVKTIEQLEVSGATGVTTISNRNTPESGKELGEYAPNYYNIKKSSLTGVTVTEKELIFRGSGYWLSSTCVVLENNIVKFALRVVGSTGITYNNVDTWGLYNSNGVEYQDVQGLRPVVTLTSSIQVVDEKAGGKTPDNAWQLK